MANANQPTNIAVTLSQVFLLLPFRYAYCIYSFRMTMNRQHKRRTQVLPTFPFPLLLSVLLLLLLLSATCCIGRMLDSNELFVGKWDVHLHCPTHRFHSQLFPPQQEQVTATQKQQHPLSPFRLGRNFPCRLHIYSNGTFHFQPSAYKNNQNQPTMDIRGLWKVHSNPYCVTDRFYDEIVLTSYARVQKEIATHTILQKGKIRMQCRLTGHFSPGRWMGGSRRPYGKGLLTRGVVIWEDWANKADKRQNHHRQPHRSVCASFSARRWIPSLASLYEKNDSSSVVQKLPWLQYRYLTFQRRMNTHTQPGTTTKS